MHALSLVSRVALALSLIALSAWSQAAETNANNPLALSAAEMKAAGVVVEQITPRRLAEEIIAPGEVVVDAYQSAQVTPRISAQVVARHARLADRVEKGEPLVTLSSVEMAAAQGALLTADREWKRVKGLGRDIVSERRYVEAQVARQLAYAKVIAYGMTPAQADALLKKGNVAQATGEFDLLAPRTGVIIRDEFVVGEIVEPGRVLFEISDPSTVWVEANLAPDNAGRVELGTTARIGTGKDQVRGKVVQFYQRLNEGTRTRPVRILVSNKNAQLYPGEFVNVAITTGETEPVLAVPRSAITLINDAEMVFRWSETAFEPVPVKTGRSGGGWVEIQAGLNAGDRIAVDGVYQLKSRLLKSQIGSE